jgi:ribosomal protein L16 Arg81 hydroxylase
MDKLKLTAIDRCPNLTKENFQSEYLKKLRPVILQDFCKDWPAKEKWNFEYLKKVAGDMVVPLYAEAFANEGVGYLKTDKKMRFTDYLDLVEKNETKLRMFLFNIYKKAPQLCQDFSYPSLVKKYLTKYPFVFFGGKGAHVDIHYDADLSHLFLTQFCGKRYIVLFDPKYSDYLYRHPFTVSTNVDIRNPDFKRYSKLKDIVGYECTLEPGETLFVPSGYWHYIYYEEGGFSLSLRSPSENFVTRLKGYLNIVNLLVFDFILMKIFGVSRWVQIKEKLAIAKAEKVSLLDTNS